MSENTEESVTKTQQKRIGDGLPGPGRIKGVPNKSTVAARESIARFVDGNVERLQGWLDEIAEDPKHGPLVAFKCVQEILEYHVPKLARTEHTGKDGGAIIVQAANGDESL
jgi:hypothetical protein